MNKIMRFFLLITSLITVAVPLNADDFPTPIICIKTNTPITDWGQGNQRFTTNFYSRLLSEAGINENFIFSPLSLQINLAMVSELALGDTQLDLIHAASAPSLARSRQHGVHKLLEAFNSTIEDWDGPSKFILANKIWLSPNTAATKVVEGIIRNSYQSEIAYIDFESNSEEARREINEWVEERTLHEIPELMSEGSITTDSRAVLVNTLYMRSPWKKSFDPAFTDEAPFYGLEKSLKFFPYMHQTETFAFAETDQFQMIDLPFKDLPENSNRISLLVLLPKEKISLDEVEWNLLSMENVASLITNMSSQRVNLTLPKFKISSMIDAKDQLQKMGHSLPFSEDAEFDLSGEAKLTITSIVHQATLEINELGGVASAGTGTTIGLTSFPVMEEPPIDFIANRPFLFFVVEKEKGIILFAGRVKQL